MTDLSLWVGIIGNVTLALFFLSPVDTFYRIVKNRSTQESKSAPYVIALLNEGLWTYYGILTPNSTLVATANGFGIVVETIFLILFLIYATPEIKGETFGLIVSMDVVFLVVVSVAEILLAGEMKIYFIGFLGVLLNMIMYGSFLEPMLTAARTEGAESIPFFLSLFCFLNGGIWTFYAILVKDIILWVPNAIGFITGACQLLLYYKCIRVIQTEQ